MASKVIAIIGGSGLVALSFLRNARPEVVTTPYGDPSAPLLIGDHHGYKVIFLQRHGVGHSTPAHKVNYRANLWALKAMQAEQIYAVAATGGISPELSARSIVVPHQLIDYTYDREHTFFDGTNNEVHHIDFTSPYTPELREALIQAAQQCEIEVNTSGVYAATQGPRLETAAEIDRLERDGATIVGMTGMPEASLARELELDYACLSLVVNPAAGRGAAQISMSEIQSYLQAGMVDISAILEQLLIRA